MSRPLHRLARLLGLGLAVAALWLAGCTDSDRVKTAAEVDEPAYREGQDLLKAGRRQEALSAFLRVIDKRGDDAPESHLSVGLIYAEQIKDPLSAIYHYRKYLALRPNGPLTAQVRQRIDAATREFARTLPAQPLESQLQRVDLVAALDRLKQENEALKEELADVKAGRNPVAVPGIDDAPVPAGPAPPGLNFTVETIPTVRTRPPPAQVRVAPAVRTAPATPPASRARQPAPSPRSHIVQPGDTLSKISLQYYGNRAKWRDIYAANRGAMKSESDLKAGMTLRIP